MGTGAAQDRVLERDAEGRLSVAGVAEALAEEEREETPIGANPYKGLAAFDEKDADRFFGRRTITEKLWEAFRALQEPAPRANAVRLLPVLGPSGSGKSSVARAGLIPELLRRPLPGLEEPKIAVFTPGAHPLEALANMLARIATGDATPVKKAGEFSEVLMQATGDGAHHGLRRIVESLTDSTSSQLILLVDQFEEIYSLCDDEEERTTFVDNLIQAAGDKGGRVSVILTLRSDFLGATTHHSDLNQIVAGQGVIIPVMTEDELREAIAEPARRAGHPIDDATVNLLISQTEGREGALPLLQFVLGRVWEGLAEGTPPAKTVEDLGGVGGALANKAKQLYDGLKPADQEIARQAFLAMVSLGEGTRDTRRRANLSEIVAAEEDTEHVIEVLRTFGRRGERLVTLSGDKTSGIFTEVTHEALFEHWGEFREWVDANREDIRFHRRLAQVARAWKEKKGGLWRPPDLDLLRDYHDRAARHMTELEAKFYSASVRRNQIENALKIAAVLVIAIFAGVTVWQWQRAEVALVQLADFLNKAISERDRALRNQSLLLAEQSLRQTRFGDAATGILLALEGLPSEADPDRLYVAEAEAALYVAVDALRERVILRGHEGPVIHAAFSPDGGRVVTASLDKTARLWDAASGKELAVLSGHASLVNHAAFSPDGGRVVTASWDKTARLWDAASGKELAVLGGHGDGVTHAAFSRDGGRVVTASSDKTARLWSILPEGQALISLANEVAPRPLTVEQRKQFYLEIEEK